MAVARHYGTVFACDKWLHGYATGEVKQHRTNWWFAQSAEVGEDEGDTDEDCVITGSRAAGTV